METSSSNIPIRYLAEDEKPREKLMLYGPRFLSNAELLAILINSGNKNASALALARQTLGSAQNELKNIQKMSWKELSKVKGIGAAKAITLTAAFELGKRQREEEAKKIIRIRSSNEAFLQFEHLLEDNDHEEFWLLLLNRGNGIIAKRKISEGGIAGTVVDPKIIFSIALSELASGIILCHNHPSGNLTPSQQDIEITRKLKDGGKLLDILVQDHIIIGNKSYFSFADDGLM
jgi:DNA repair protein RadC